MKKEAFTTQKIPEDEIIRKNIEQIHNEEKTREQACNYGIPSISSWVRYLRHTHTIKSMLQGKIDEDNDLYKKYIHEYHKMWKKIQNTYLEDPLTIHEKFPAFHSEGVIRKNEKKRKKGKQKTP